MQIGRASCRKSVDLGGRRIIKKKSEGQTGKQIFDKGGNFQVQKSVKWGVILDSFLSMGVTSYLE